MIDELQRIRSAIRGRERWQIDRLRSRPRYAAAVERELSRHAPIREARANALTGRLLVVYDPGVQRDEVHERIRASLGIAPATPDELRHWRAEWPRGFSREAEAAVVEQARRRLILSGTVLAGVALKRLLFGAGALAGAHALVTASSVFAILEGYNALRHGVEAFSARTLIRTMALGVLAAAESFPGMGALVAAHAGEFFEAKAMRDSRAAIQMLDSWWEGGADFIREHRTRVEPFEVIAVAELIIAGGALVITGNPHRSLAMLHSASPVAAKESRNTARGLAMLRGQAKGILFRDPDAVSSLPRKAALVFDGASALESAPRDFGETLRAAGARRTILLTTESADSGRAAARDAGLDGSLGNLSARQKFEVLDAIRAEGLAPVVVAGEEDGAPELLRAAHIGMAFVSRSAPGTLHAADVLLLEPDLRSVATALMLMRRTSGVVREDEWLSQLAGLAGFSVATFGRLSAAAAAHLHNYTRLAMELNSLRLAWV